MDLPSFIIALGQLFNQFVAIVAWPIVVAILIYAIRDPLRDIVARLIHGPARATAAPPTIPPSAAETDRPAGEER